MGIAKIFAAILACSSSAIAWRPLPDAQLSSFVFPGQQDAYGWRGNDAPTCENLSCDVRNTGKWTDGQQQLDAFAGKWGGNNQNAVDPDGTPMIATFGHCLVKTQKCGQCGMMKFQAGQEYELSTKRKFTAKQSLNILVMCIDNAEEAATFSYETSANDYLAAIIALGAHDLDTNAHPLVTEIEPVDCLTGSISDSTTLPSGTTFTITVIGGTCSGAPCDRQDQCRSEWGFCGVTGDHCNAKSFWCGSDTTGCQCGGSPVTAAATTTTTTAMIATQITTTGGAGTCPGEPCDTAMHCRSEWGFCGITTAHCNAKSQWCGSSAAGCQCGSKRRLRGGAK
jgi:hypothetical protein